MNVPRFSHIQRLHFFKRWNGTQSKNERFYTLEERNPGHGGDPWPRCSRWWHPELPAVPQPGSTNVIPRLELKKQTVYVTKTMRRFHTTGLAYERRGSGFLLSWGGPYTGVQASSPHGRRLAAEWRGTVPRPGGCVASSAGLWGPLGGLRPQGSPSPDPALLWIPV